MTNLTGYSEHDCNVDSDGDIIDRLLNPKEKDLGGFSVRRLLPTTGQRMLGPWVFFDHMGPADFAAGDGINVRPHPHIGIATVTYLFEGEILHRDSLGSHQRIRPGDINLMVAGRGITHSERERPEISGAAHRQHGLQLWIALPEESEEIDPAFYHYPASAIPTRNINGVPVRVMMGSAYGISSPVKIFTDTLYAEAHLQVGQQLTLPAAEELGVYVAQGGLTVGNTVMPTYSMAVVSDGSNICVTAAEESRIAVVGGAKMTPRYIEWNFVSSSKERLEKAKQDWREGRFDKVVGDEEEFIPLPD